MGHLKDYRSEGGFNQYLYAHCDIIIDGYLQAKVVFMSDTTDFHESLPLYSNTSDMYFGIKRDKDTEDIYIDQLRIYKNRKAYMDFDWGHEHIVRKGRKEVKRFPAGVVHVQRFKIIEGLPIRDGNMARLMNNAEIKEYGAFLKKAFPGVRFRLPRQNN